MTYQKWIVLIAFLILFSFLAEVKSSPTCLEEVVQQLEETLTSVENFTYAGKSSSCPVKVKRRLDKKTPAFTKCFYIYRKDLLVLGPLHMSPVTGLARLPG